MKITVLFLIFFAFVSQGTSRVLYSDPFVYPPKPYPKGYSGACPPYGCGIYPERMPRTARYRDCFLSWLC